MLNKYCLLNNNTDRNICNIKTVSINNFLLKPKYRTEATKILTIAIEIPWFQSNLCGIFGRNVRSDVTISTISAQIFGSEIILSVVPK